MSDAPWNGWPPDAMATAFHKLRSPANGLMRPVYWHADKGMWDFLDGPLVSPADCVASGWGYYRPELLQ